jgi:hypothetical protein
MHPSGVTGQKKERELAQPRLVTDERHRSRVTFAADRGEGRGCRSIGREFVASPGSRPSDLGVEKLCGAPRPCERTGENHVHFRRHQTESASREPEPLLAVARERAVRVVGPAQGVPLERDGVANHDDVDASPLPLIAT